MNDPRTTRASGPPMWLSVLLTVALVVFTACLRLIWMRDAVVPIGLGVPIVLSGWFRNRTLTWAMAVAFAAIIIVKYAVYPVPTPDIAHRVLAAGMLLLDLAIITIIVDIAVAARDRLHVQNDQLAQNNRELADREEEIARQNEELQSQAEELERQAEELRVANSELASREHMLEQLLELSRGISGPQSRAQVMEKICQVLWRIMDVQHVAAAILERRGDRMVVCCHAGFEANQLAGAEIPYAQSFASLTLALNKTGYLEDLSLRPDLQVLQSRGGPPTRSILASPLGFGGDFVGTLELYSTDKHKWRPDEIALIESLAAQASVSLEAARLFERVADGKERFEAVIRALPVGVIIANADATDVRVNPAGAMILNVPVDENLASSEGPMPGRMFRGGKLVEGDAHPLLSSLHTGVDVPADEFEMVGAHGRRISLLVSAGPFRDHRGKVVGAVKTFVDITRQKDLQRELDTRRREAEEASIRKTRFLAAVSHDIRTPANAINLLAELIRRAATNADLFQEVPEMSAELQQSATSLVSLVSDVLDVARYDSGKVELQETRIALAEMLQQETRQLQPLAQQKGLLLEVDSPPSTLFLQADRIKLARVIGNLLGNAIKFTEHGSVRVGATRLGSGELRIEVRDTGVGIDPEHLPRIFDEFYQLRNPERDRQKGTGLGLAISKRLVEAMGGQLNVQSEPGKGSAFALILPASAVLSEEAASTIPAPRIAPAGSIHPSNGDAHPAAAPAPSSDPTDA